jgi:ferredoxin
VCYVLRIHTFSYISIISLSILKELYNSVLCIILFSFFSKTLNISYGTVLWFARVFIKLETFPFVHWITSYWTSREMSHSVKMHRAANDDKSSHVIWVTVRVTKRCLCCGWCHVACSSKDGEINLFALTFISEVWTESTINHLKKNVVYLSNLGHRRSVETR